MYSAATTVLGEQLDLAMRGTDLNWFERRQMRRRVWKNRRDVVIDSFRQFLETVPDGEFASGVTLGEDDSDDRPIIEFWQWLIESDRIQAFMTFLVEDFLPKLFQLIMMFVVL